MVRGAPSRALLDGSAIVALSENIHVCKLIALYTANAYSDECQQVLVLALCLVKIYWSYLSKVANFLYPVCIWRTRWWSRHQTFINDVRLWYQKLHSLGCVMNAWNAGL